MTTHFITPASDRNGVSATDVIKSQLTKGYYSWGASTPHVNDLKPGDRICFCAAHTGVVASAVVATSARHSGMAGDPFPMVFQVHDPHFFLPVEIDEELRAKLNAFESKDPSSHYWSWFVFVTREVTEHALDLLTRE